MTGRLDVLRQGRLVALFVPANRPERFAKALAAGADAVIIDLEDAVGPAEKDEARRAVASAIPATGTILLRINAIATPHHAEDVQLARTLPLAGVVVPKIESPAEAERMAATFGENVPLIALIESARGLAAARAIAAVPHVVRLAFGSFDFAADLGCAHNRQAMLMARSELVLAARLAQQQGPIDGVTPELDDAALAQSDAAHAAELGFTGKLCVHPRQIAPVMRGFAPTEEEIAWAHRVFDASSQDGSALRVDGALVDLPVRLRAQRILSRIAPM